MERLFIGFSSPINFKIGAEAIKWWTNSLYSHCYLRFEYKNSKTAIFHAAHGMVHFRSETNFFRENKSIKEYEIQLTDQSHSELFDECMDLAGENYGKVELIKIFLSDIIYSMARKEIPWENSSGYICSELVGKLCIDRLGLSFSKPTYLLKPFDIDSKLKEFYQVTSPELT